MKIWTVPFLLAVVLVVVPMSRAEPKIGSPSRSLVTLDDPAGWTIGVRAQFDTRAFDTGTDDLDIDITHLVARMGYSLTPFASLYAEAGTSYAEQENENEEGERGLEWAALLEVSLVEYVMRESPVVGRQETLSLATTVSYRQSESNFDDVDFSWNELSVVPTVSYTLNRRVEAIGHAYEPNGARARIGLLFATIDGEYGNEDVEEDRNFAFVAGADLLSSAGWVLGIDAAFYGSSDRTLSLGLQYNF